MAEASECRMRLFEYQDIAGAFLNDLPPQIKAAEPKLLNLHIVGKPADIAGFSEIDAITAVCAYSTAVVAEVVSSSADDNGSATGHVQSFSTIGIDGEDEIVQRSEPLHATVGTTVRATTNLYKEMFHLFADAHGSGDMDAAGNVDFRETDNTVIGRIPAGDNEGNGSAFLVPDNHIVILYGGTLKRASVATDEGVKLRILYIDPIDAESGMAAADRAINWIDFYVGGTCVQIEIPKGRVFEPGTWIHFYHSSLVDAGEDYDLELNFLIVKK